MQRTFQEIVNEQIPIKALLSILSMIALFAVYGIYTTANTGTIIVHSPAYRAQVFIDGREVGTKEEASTTLRLSETAGKHNIIVSKENYWPWTQDVILKRHGAAELHPFIVSKNIAMEPVPRSSFSGETVGINSEYAEALAFFDALAISEEIKPLVSATHIQSVTYADYFPGRTDVLLIATADGIYAVGVENGEHPNFQPVYKGENPLFAKTADGTLYIKDGDSILRATGLAK